MINHTLIGRELTDSKYNELFLSNLGDIMTRYRNQRSKGQGTGTNILALSNKVNPVVLDSDEKYRLSRATWDNTESPNLESYIPGPIPPFRPLGNTSFGDRHRDAQLFQEAETSNYTSGFKYYTRHYQDNENKQNGSDTLQKNREQQNKGLNQQKAEDGHMITIREEDESGNKDIEEPTHQALPKGTKN